MSTYNGEQYLEQQIVSVLNQENCEVELLIRDDGSTDKTMDIIRKYSSLYNVDYYCDSVSYTHLRAHET